MHFEQLMGSVAIDGIEPPHPDGLETWLAIGFDDRGSHGTLEGTLTYRDGDRVSATPFTIASWGERDVSGE